MYYLISVISFTLSSHNMLAHFLVWQINLLSQFLGRTYKANQIIGCLLVKAGVVLSVRRYVLEQLASFVLTTHCSKNRCWTTDLLGRRGLPCPAACPLCDQELEMLQHLLFGCVVAREIWA
jgi:hypothetical protein